MFVQWSRNFGWQSHDWWVRIRLSNLPLRRFRSNKSRCGSRSWLGTGWEGCTFSAATFVGSARSNLRERLRLPLEAPRVLSLKDNPVFLLGFLSPVVKIKASGETGIYGWKMGSLSSSNKFPVSTSHAGYFARNQQVSQENVRNETIMMPWCLIFCSHHLKWYERTIELHQSKKGFGTGCF